MGVLFLLFFVLVAHTSSSAFKTQTPISSRLLILFLDGLRWDYFNYLDEESGIGWIRTHGCHVPRVKSVFPSNCYANVHALFAGHNSTHLDTFSDDFKAKYAHPELLWNRAINQSKTVKLFHFPFCSDLNGTGLECIQPMTEQPPLKATLKDALQSLLNQTTDLAAVYCGELDHAAHIYGASNQSALRKVVQKVDEAVFSIISLLQASSLNFAIVADHGMTDFKDFLVVDRLFKWADVENVANLGSVVGFWPKQGAEQDLIKELSKSDHFHVYTPHTMPVTSWRRSQLPPIVAIAKPGYVFQMDLHPFATWDHLSSHNISLQPRGVHGYLSDVSDMHTTFLAYGPAFKSNCSRDEGLYTYDLFPHLNYALFGENTAIEVMGGSVPERGWKVELLLGMIFALFAVFLILVLAIRRLLKIQRRHADALLDDDDFNDADDNCIKDV